MCIWKRKSLSFVRSLALKSSATIRRAHAPIYPSCKALLAYGASHQVDPLCILILPLPLHLRTIPSLTATSKLPDQCAKDFNMYRRGACIYVMQIQRIHIPGDTALRLMQKTPKSKKQQQTDPVNQSRSAPRSYARSRQENKRIEEAMQKARCERR